MDAPAPEPLSQWAMARDGARLFFHATGVALGDKGILILGSSGSGKSSLALALMVHGAQLISDDGIWLDGPDLIRPKTAPPFIEARGIGLLNAGPIMQSAQLHLVIDLNREEPQRLPPSRFVDETDQKAQLILGAGQPTLAVAILHLLLHGRTEPQP